MSKDSAKGERIAKRLSRVGVASRRDAERMITEGRVTVNGTVIDSPALNVTASDRILIDGKPIAAAEPPRLWLYHKPSGLVTTARDELGRETIFDALPEGLPRVMPVGRLDLTSEGLLLLTNDGMLKRRLELPSTGWLRKYRVRVNGQPEDATLGPLRRGVEVDGETFQPMTVSIDRQQGANAWLTVSLREGRNREIRRAMEAVGLVVNRLIRISYGPFRLGEIEPGAVEEVKQRVLRDQLGLQNRIEAGEDATDEAAARPAERARRSAGPSGSRSGSRPGSAARGSDAGAPASGPRSSGPRSSGPRSFGSGDSADRSDRPRRTDRAVGDRPARSTTPGGYRAPWDEPETGDAAEAPRKPRHRKSDAADGTFSEGRSPRPASDGPAAAADRGPGRSRAPKDGDVGSRPHPRRDGEGFGRDGAGKSAPRSDRSRGEASGRERPSRDGDRDGGRDPGRQSQGRPDQARKDGSRGGSAERFGRSGPASRSRSEDGPAARPRRATGSAGEADRPRRSAGSDEGGSRPYRARSAAPRGEDAGPAPRRSYAPRDEGAAGESRAPRKPRQAGEPARSDARKSDWGKSDWGKSGRTSRSDGPRPEGPRSGGPRSDGPAPTGSRAPRARAVKDGRGAEGSASDSRPARSPRKSPEGAAPTRRGPGSGSGSGSGDGASRRPGRGPSDGSDGPPPSRPRRPRGG